MVMETHREVWENDGFSHTNGAVLKVFLCLVTPLKRHKKMENPAPPGLNNNQDAATNQSSRRLSMQRCIQSLVHACQCRNTSCSLPSCQTMKRVVQHTKGCQRKTNGGCPVCKELIALCCYHAKHCQERVCPVFFCLKIKHKLRQQRLQRLQQLQQALMPRQRHHRAKRG
ncbi:histone acetyltransferase p300-like isoform X2 [Gouania willdenowi]|uniref:histone acetyltransferase p300-like isoform X2 n=1 Tax=Gouania willdenowi TaxID=441366 RepID=UPI0010565472|nr:histone acetyltransferase p300-like isoform X2 [Gouania willdenowi]